MCLSCSERLDHVGFFIYCSTAPPLHVERESVSVNFTASALVRSRTRGEAAVPWRHRKFPLKDYISMRSVPSTFFPPSSGNVAEEIPSDWGRNSWARSNANFRLLLPLSAGALMLCHASAYETFIPLRVPSSWFPVLHFTIWKKRPFAEPVKLVGRHSVNKRQQHPIKLVDSFSRQIYDSSHTIHPSVSNLHYLLLVRPIDKDKTLCWEKIGDAVMCTKFLCCYHSRAALASIDVLCVLCRPGPALSITPQEGLWASLRVRQ